jgi:hypothetical protein
MIDNAIGGAPAAVVRTAVEFFTIELAHMADGNIFVSLTATTVDEEEPQLLNQELVSSRVPTIEEALALVADHVRAVSHPADQQKER